MALANFAGRGHTLTEQREASPSAPEATKPRATPSVSKLTTMSNTVPDKSSFTVAVITTLICELDAVEDVLDDGTDFYPGSDSFTYRYGKIWAYDLLVVKLEQAGAISASQNVEHLVRNFPSLKLILLVGVCAGVAQPPGRADIFLGDIIIGNSLLNYSQSMRWNPNDVYLRRNLPQQSHYRKVQQTLTYLETRRTRRDFQKALDLSPVAKKITSTRDELFKPDYHHIHHDLCPQGQCNNDTGAVCDIAPKLTCDKIKCDPAQRIIRDRPASIKIHVGCYASAPFVMRNPTIRDNLAKEWDVLAFEMEATGLWDVERPVVPIKGVCDYADSHKNKAAQGDAAIMAAYAMKEFVRIYFGAAPHFQGQETQTNLGSSTSQQIKRHLNTHQDSITKSQKLPRYYEPVYIPPDLHRLFSAFFNGSFGDNLLLWGRDRGGWLCKAMGSLALTHGPYPNVYIDCTKLSCAESFISQMVEAICSCWPDISPQLREVLQDNGSGAIKILDASLSYVVPVLIYDMDVLPKRDLQADGAVLEWIEVLMEAEKFKVFLYGYREVAIKYPQSRSTKKDIGEWFITHAWRP